MWILINHRKYQQDGHVRVKEKTVIDCKELERRNTLELVFLVYFLTPTDNNWSNVSKVFLVSTTKFDSGKYFSNLNHLCFLFPAQHSREQKWKQMCSCGGSSELDVLSLAQITSIIDQSINYIFVYKSLESRDKYQLQENHSIIFQLLNLSE